MAFGSYMPEKLMQEDEKELRKEYTRLRDIAHKRMQRLQQSEFADSPIARYWKSEIPKLRDMKSKEDIAFALSEVKGFVDSPYSTLKGAREKQEEKIKRIRQLDPKLKQILGTIDRHHGLKLNKRTADSFFDFMNTKLATEIGNIYGSDRILQMYKVLKEKGVRNFQAYQSTKEQFSYFLLNLENLEAVNVDKKKGERMSVGKFKQLIESELHHGRDRSLMFKEKFADEKLDDLKPKPKRKYEKTGKYSKKNRKK